MSERGPGRGGGRGGGGGGRPGRFDTERPPREEESAAVAEADGEVPDIADVADEGLDAEDTAQAVQAEDAG
jgi:hypothetical protein